MSDKQQIKDIVLKVALLQDMKQWERLEEYFVRKPFVDNKALSGEMPAIMPKKRLIENWRKEMGHIFMPPGTLLGAWAYECLTRAGLE